MKQTLLLALLMLSFNMLHAQQFPAAKNAKLSYKLITAENKTWGYDIYNNEKLFVHQPSIPAMPGNKGFATKASAEKLAKKEI